MRLIFFSSIFLFLLIASNASAQTPTSTAAGTIVPTGTVPPESTSTIPPTSTILPTNTVPPTATPDLCLPVIDPDSHVSVRWEPSDKAGFMPGDQITFWAGIPNRIVYWIVNGEYIAAVYPTPTPWPTRSTTPTPTRQPVAPTAVPTSPYPAPGATDTPVPSPTSESAYPAPVQAAAAQGDDRCSWPSPDCLTMTMPASCQLFVGTVCERCVPQGTTTDPVVDMPTFEPFDATPTHTPAPPQPTDPTSIPEPLTIVLFGIGVTGVAGYARWRRR
ncbi:MAG: PEP-CTERM sorting domain-containing protein [Chloroflexota bacterium]